ncbi:Zinc finger BED domain-containing protein 1 [Merluccius polli]|uniref:Zinc finger BED domain-containing protein 1 n=1 Tax=Merluccius polli TaxID=89951 RepID=A0AA47NXT3_MERPO|nr:Zinc finger BED domain-containing protein 1 [Merluccius polli]
MHKALHPFQELTDALSGEEYVSVSYLKPVLHLLRTKTLVEEPKDVEFTKPIKFRALHYLDEYSDPDTQELLDAASFLDPRVKMHYISQENIPAIKERMTQRWNTQQERELDEASTRKTKKSLGSYFKSAALASATTPASFVQLDNTIKAELDNYLMTPAIDGEEAPLSPYLAWWKLHQFNFLRLSSQAHRYLCIPATSSLSERLFSTGGNIVTC